MLLDLNSLYLLSKKNYMKKLFCAFTLLMFIGLTSFAQTGKHHKKHHKHHGHHMMNKDKKMMDKKDDKMDKKMDKKKM